MINEKVENMKNLNILLRYHHLATTYVTVMNNASLTVIHSLRMDSRSYNITVRTMQTCGSNYRVTSYPGQAGNLSRTELGAP